MTQKEQNEIEKNQLDFIKKLVKNDTNTREEYLKKILPLLIIKEKMFKIECGKSLVFTPAIKQIKFELLSDQKLDTPNNIKQKNIKNYLDWLKELNQNDNNADLIIDILMK